MKAKFISELYPGDEITDFFLVKSIAVKTGSNGKNYLDMQLADKTGDVYAKKWDASDEETSAAFLPKVGGIIKVRAQVTEWNGQRQMKVQKLRTAKPGDGLDVADFFRSAPRAPEEMYAYIEKTADSIDDEDFRIMTQRVLADNRERLLYYPAAAKNHHAIHAGLLYHMTRMLEMAEKFCEVYGVLNRDLLVTGVIFHDMEKLYEMAADENGVVSDYTFEGILLGHLVQGVVAIDRLAEELQVPYEKKIMLAHMVLSHHYEPEYGSVKKPLFPEAEALHYLDMVDSKLYDMETALEGTTAGGFSDRVWTLDNRRIYKRQW
ncbi:MAG: HD domain-containing protein [Clostridiales Family XIII bacterium]|jgi:3'-5' exoribonuclease|nr:HD domain-containing protein [Clostridiales Family XIII bacterium]